MNTRASWFSVVLGVAVLAAGCGGPYKGKPDKLPKGPKKKEEPVEVAPAAEAIKYDEECAAKFIEDPNRAKKSSSKAAPHINSADDAMSRAAGATDPQAQANELVNAISDYKKALIEDHYNPEATYKLAVAYAQVRKKGCALKMLGRLGDLAANDKLAGGSMNLDRWKNQVEDEPAFAPFRVQASDAVSK